MRNAVCLRSRHSVSKTDIIRINGMAKKDKQRGNTVINASIGTFLDDERNVGSVALINQSLSENITSDLGYPSVYGNHDYLNGVMDFVFEDKRKMIEDRYSVFIGATLGGTGACSMAFELFLEQGEEVLLPSVMWSNYKLIARKAEATYRIYEQFDENGGFNLKSVEETIRASFKEHEHIVFVLNDPCQNPTGYCLTKEEYDELFDIFERCSSLGQLTVLFDIAYMAFNQSEDAPCVMIDKLAEGNLHFLPVIAFSCSKVFGLYGLRLGALIALAEDEEEKEEISRAFGAQARGTYSVPVGTAQAAVSKILNNPDKKQELLAQVKKNSDVVFQRGKSLLKALDEAKIPHYPYKSGFFISLKLEHAYEIFEKLKGKHIYIVPMNDNMIRIALSGMTEDECLKLVEAFKEVL